MSLCPLCICMFLYACLCACVCEHICVFRSVHVCVCVCFGACACVCVCVCVSERLLPSSQRVVCMSSLHALLSPDSSVSMATVCVCVWLEWHILCVPRPARPYPPAHPLRVRPSWT